MPWLKEKNPIMIWADKTIKISPLADQTPQYNQENAQSWESFLKKVSPIPSPSTKPTYPNRLPYDFIWEDPCIPDETFIKLLCNENPFPTSLNWFKKVQGKFLPVTPAKTSISTELTQEADKKEVVLSPKYSEFTSVFS